MKRRDFIKVGATTFACGNITASYADEAKKDDTAVLFLFLGGGASHIETFNPVPFAPAVAIVPLAGKSTVILGIESAIMLSEKVAVIINVPVSFLTKLSASS